MRRTILQLAAVLTVILAGCSSGGGGSDEGSSSSSDDGPPATQIERVASCGTEELDNATLNQLSILFTDFKNARSAFSTSVSRGEIVDVPVVFHVVARGESPSEGNIPDSQLIENINVLNRAYSGETGGVPTPFRFHLANITRTVRPEWHVINPGNDAEREVKQALKQGGAETLNVYVAKIDDNVLGYAMLPVFYPLIAYNDGIVLNYVSVPGGELDRYNTGHVLVHEAGHWLGLLHTFQGECDGFIGDLVPDTPPEKFPEKGQFCPVGRDSCPDQPGVDPVHNHMTYTDDNCRFEFTENQVELMRFNVFAFRGLGTIDQ